MNDDQLDHLVRDADPYRPGRLGGAEQNLLEEIMSVPTSESRARRRVLAGALATAAAITGAFAIFAVTRPETAAPPPVAVAPVKPATSSKAPELRFSPVAMKVAEKNPRLLIEEPGWTADTVYGFEEATGTIDFSNGDRSLEMNWYPKEEYAGRANLNTDKGVKKLGPVKVDGWPAMVHAYSDDDLVATLEPRGDVFATLRGGAGNREDFYRVLDHVRHVDVPTWLAALPADIVTPDKIADTADEMLKGLPLPPDFDKKKLAKAGTNSPYHFGAAVTRLVACGWISEWHRADKAGDEAAKKRAADALGTSHDWKVLKDMNAEGGWSEVLWEIADGYSKHGGRLPPHNSDPKSALGC